MNTLTDFEYAGELLSDYDSIVAHVTTSPDVGTKAFGGNITFNTVQNKITSKVYTTSTSMDGTYASDPIQIIKNPCSKGGSFYSDLEARQIIAWLSRKEFHKFRPLYSDGYYDVYYNASFNVSAITLGDDIIGFELNMQTDSPNAYADEVVYEDDVVANGSIIIVGNSDEEGLLNMNMTVTCKANGTLTIKNLYNNKATVINNCISGEVITLDGSNKIIQTSKAHPTLYNDFNYMYPKLAVEYGSVENEIQFSLPCHFTLSYTPVRKVGVVH